MFGFEFIDFLYKLGEENKDIYFILLGMFKLLLVFFKRFLFIKRIVFCSLILKFKVGYWNFMYINIIFDWIEFN